MLYSYRKITAEGEKTKTIAPQGVVESEVNTLDYPKWGFDSCTSRGDKLQDGYSDRHRSSLKPEALLPLPRTITKPKALNPAEDQVFHKFLLSLPKNVEDLVRLWRFGSSNL